MVAKVPPLHSLLVERGDPISARGWNALVRAVSRDIRLGKGLGDGFDKIPMRFRRPDKIRAANRDIPAYSVLVPVSSVVLGAGDRDDFVVQNVDYYESPPIVTDLDGCYLTNGGDPLREGEITSAIPIIDYEPYLVTYTGTAPAYGDELEVSDGSFSLVKQDGGEFKAISEPNTDYNLIWVTRKSSGGAGSTIAIGKLILDLPDGIVDDVFKEYELPSGNTPTDKGFPPVDVLNITGETLRTGVWMYKFDIQDFWVPITYPEEFDECFQPDLQMQTGGMS